MKATSVVTASMLLMLAARGYAGLITNGSFESPVVTGSFDSFSTGSSFGGWTVVGAVGEVALAKGTLVQNGFSFLSQDGEQWLDLTGFNSNSATGVQQTVATNVGKSYDLSFWVGNVVDENPLPNIFGTTSSVEGLVDSASQGTFTNTAGAGTFTQNWQQFTLSFSASNAVTQIQFLNADSSSDNSNGLDNVALTQSAVPEPSTFILMGLSISGMFGYGWRRRKPKHAA